MFIWSPCKTEQNRTSMLSSLSERYTERKRIKKGIMVACLKFGHPLGGRIYPTLILEYALNTEFVDAVGILQKKS